MAGRQVVRPIDVFTNDGVNVLLAFVCGGPGSIQVIPAPFSGLKYAQVLYLQLIFYWVCESIKG